MIVFGNETAGHMIANAARAHFCPSRDQVIARVRGEKIFGGIIYQRYCGASLQCQLAGFHPNWVTPDLLWMGFHYPFEQLKCRVLFATVKSNNTRARNIYAKLGFKEQFRTPNVYDDGADLVMLSMARDECRWLSITPKTVRAGGSIG